MQMAGSVNAIRKITIHGSTQGISHATKRLNTLAAAMRGVAAVSAGASKRVLSAKRAYERQALLIAATSRVEGPPRKV
jgi:hypothetical protein